MHCYARFVVVVAAVVVVYCVARLGRMSELVGSLVKLGVFVPLGKSYPLYVSASALSSLAAT